jgi:hypothetical protein
MAIIHASQKIIKIGQPFMFANEFIINIPCMINLMVTTFVHVCFQINIL